MKFERWNGTTEAGKNVTHADKIVKTTASQASRADAHRDPAAACKFSSYEEEYQDLLRRKRDMLAEMAGYNKAKLLQQQTEIRRRNPGQKGMREWLNFRADKEARRLELSGRLAEIEAKLAEIKPRLRAERVDESDRLQAEARRTMGLIGQQQVELLTEILGTLEAIRDRLPAPQTRQEETPLRH